MYWKRAQKQLAVKVSRAGTGFLSLLMVDRGLSRMNIHRNIINPSLTMRILEKRTTQPEMPKDEETKGEVNMEASVTTDDVVRAGGFGATDGISSFLPVAMDCTDFECSLRDARDFEEPQGEISRPGLGYLNSKIDKDACS